MPLPRYEKKLPAILSKPEVKALLETPRSLKQRAMFATMYGAGLRVSEVANLKVADLDRERRVIWVRGAKGHKDRQVMLSESLRRVLIVYWRRQQPTDWLFPGKKPDRPITSNSVFKACVAAAGITDSRDLPVSRDAFQRTAQGSLDAFVAKFEGAGYRAVAVTYFGGTKDDSSGYDGDDIKIDSAGNVWLVGLTSSRDLPMLRAMQPAYGGGESDGFLAVFSPKLTKLCYATYRGGSDRDLLEGLDVSGDGDVLATGLTFSKDLPMPSRTVQSQLSMVTVGGRVTNATVLGLRALQLCR